jgi:ADP-heptose:LPS heptosyltransferase
MPADGDDTGAPIALPTNARILLLQLQQVGDSLVMSPTLRAVRDRYPQADVDVLTTPVGYEVHKGSPHIRRLFVAPGQDARRTGRLRWWLHTTRELRQAGYDCVLACRNHVSARYVLVALVSGARHRIGFDEAPGGFLFTRRLHVGGQESVIQTNLRLAAAIGADGAHPREEFWFDGRDEAHVASLLAAHAIGEARLAVLHVASNWQSKTWYAERWAAVADWAARQGLHPVFVGRTCDAGLVAAVQSLMEASSTSLAGATDLCQLGALLARADLFIGTDSGPRHIAGALGRPQVTIMSSLDEPWRWVLNRPREVVLRTDPACRGCLLSACDHRRCMDLIPADQAIAACQEVLRRVNEPTNRRIPISVS